MPKGLKGHKTGTINWGITCHLCNVHITDASARSGESKYRLHMRAAHKVIAKPTAEPIVGQFDSRTRAKGAALNKATADAKARLLLEQLTA